MYIKEINITGFRSYRELTTISNFSPAHNVVVGRNGSGKSNFFSAIQFVIGEETHLNQEQRQAILHESVGARIITAKVEIVFDNTDRRIPSVESDEVRVSRQIGNKKDQYFIDNKPVNRSDINNLMESAGFSKSNPYYIVKQGKINELATAPDAYRLKLLREVAGTRVYDEKKEESVKLFHETDLKLQKSETLLGFMEERLKKLEEEKEDLKEYQKWDKTKRAIEYTIYDLEVSEARKKIDKLSNQRDQLNSEQNRLETDLMKIQKNIIRVESDLRKLEARFKGVKEERESLMADQQERTAKKTELELQIKDLQEDVDKERSSRDNAEEMLEQLKQEIAQREEELRDLEPEYQRLMTEEAQLAADIRIAEQTCKELYAKQGHQERFKSQGERDKFLQREVKFLQQQKDETEAQITEIERSMKEEEEDCTAMQNNLMELQISISENMAKMDNLSQRYTALKAIQDQATTAHMNATRAEKQARETLMAAQAEVNQAENDLRRLTSKPVVEGINSVRTVINHFKEKNPNGINNDVINGYYGCIIDLIDCEHIYYQAIEVTADSRLFYHVVETDKVAMKILDAINKQEMRGEVNFFPLNRVMAKPKKFPNDQDARAILDPNVLRFNEKFDVVMRSIFATTVIVRDLKAGTRVSKQEFFDCVTLEGDQVSRRGPMTGGYIDVKRSRLECSRAIREANFDRAKLEKNVEEASQKTSKCATEADVTRRELSQIEMDMAQLRQEHRTITDAKRQISEQVNRRNLTRDSRRHQLLTLQNRLRELEAHITSLNGQIGQVMHSQLTPEEMNKIEQLENQIKNNKERINKVTNQRTELENKKHRAENQLQTNLLRRRENLSAKIQDISVEERRHRLSAAYAELKLVNERLHQIMARLAEVDENLSEYDEESRKLNADLEKHQEQKKDLDGEISELAKQADALCTKVAAYQAKREESSKKIREIGSLPTEALGTYQNYGLKQLDKKLTECINELKKYENVNKKALDQFVRANTQKELLTKQVEEMRKGKESIEDLMDVLENRKYETLQLTFKQVAKNFEEVFKKLVPLGEGKIIVKAHDPTSDSSADAANLPQFERYSGVGIRVSFTGGSETREMQHLSGGQKSLVALALIFAIQKCDPAPFYLFDEIDAALDAEHRRSVAQMIHELAERAQFITTTFRPELLESAEKFFGVRFRNKISYIDPVTKEQAADFIQDDQTHT